MHEHGLLGQGGELREHALGLAERVREQHAGPPPIAVALPPIPNLGGYAPGTGPSIRRQGECGLADEHIAGHDLERIARGIGIAFVVP